LFEAVAETPPVVAIAKVVVEPWRCPETAIEWLRVAFDAESIGVVKAGAGRDSVGVRNRLRVTAAVSSDAYADRESGLREHRASRQEHHRQQFRFHRISFFLCLRLMHGKGRTVGAMDAEINPTWARFSGGAGAPGWCFQAATISEC
jgi:hypothetical protein